MRKLVLIASLILSTLCFFAFYSQYFKWRDCFNTLGRCFDDEAGVVYHEQSGMVWLSLALITLGFALYQLWRIKR